MTAIGGAVQAIRAALRWAVLAAIWIYCVGLTIFGGVVFGPGALGTALMELWRFVQDTPPMPTAIESIVVIVAFGAVGIVITLCDVWAVLWMITSVLSWSRRRRAGQRV